jgi:hypothetical protein
MSVVTFKAIKTEQGAAAPVAAGRQAERVAASA